MRYVGMSQTDSTPHGNTMTPPTLTPTPASTKTGRKNAKWDKVSRKRLFELRDEYDDLFSTECNTTRPDRR